MQPNQPLPAEPARHIAAEVRAEMFRQGMTQTALADRLGWPQARVARRLCARVDFRAPELERVAEILGVPVAQFLGTAAANA